MGAEHRSETHKGCTIDGWSLGEVFPADKVKDGFLQVRWRLYLLTHQRSLASVT